MEFEVGDKSEIRISKSEIILKYSSYKDIYGYGLAPVWKRGELDRMGDIG
jgi:hypothetical protein